MEETIVRFVRGPMPKKYTAFVLNKRTQKVRKIHFGDRRYEQFKDRTPLQLYRAKDHGSRARRQKYFSRHSGTRSKQKAIQKEVEKSGGLYTAKILSHTFLW